MVAASSIPKLVPLTEAKAESIISSVSFAVLPKAFSFALASSIPVRRLKPLTNVTPVNAEVAATAGLVIVLVSLLPILLILSPTL